MALAEFLRNVRRAASFLAPQATTGNGRPDEEFKRVLRAAMIWLLPEAVEGFDSNELSWIPDLTTEKRKRLQKGVQEFRDEAGRIRGGEQATPGQVEKAFKSFLEILEILRPFLDEAAIRANRLLIEAGPWPEGVIGFVCESATDSEGEPALFVWVVVDEKVKAIDKLVPNSREISLLVMEALRNIGRVVYVRFRTASEVSYFYSDDE